jgi:hypothetical protein
MKSIRIATTVKYLEGADHQVTLFRIQEILSEHRAALITRILSDLPSYLEFKRYSNVGKDIIEIVKGKLFDLSTSKVNLEDYYEIVHEINRSNNYRVPNQDFFKEIDCLLDAELNPSQLTLIK